MRPAMRFAWLLLSCALLALGWTAACTRANPAYCDSDADCALALFPRCDQAIHACVPDGVDEQDGGESDGDPDGDGGSDEAGGDQARTGLFVAASACPESGDGSEADPFCTIGEALEELIPGGTVWIAAGAYAENLSLSSDATLVGEPGTQLSAPACPVVTVTNGARVVLQELQVTSTGSGSNGLVQVVGNSSLEAVGFRLGPSGCVGLRCVGASCALARATVQGNSGGGLDFDQTLFDVTNSFISWNGGQGQVGGARLGQARSGSIFAFNTVAYNEVQGMEGGGLDCLTAFAADSCILWENDPIDVSANCTVNYSDVSQEPGEFTGTDNQNADPAFKDEGAGDLHLLPGSPCINLGNPGPAVVPTEDYDGEPRPRGGRADQGADEAG